MQNVTTELITNTAKTAKLKPTYYSGQGMNGVMCVAFTGKATSILNKLARNNPEQMTELVKIAKVAQLGKNEIVYFPSAILTYDEAAAL